MATENISEVNKLSQAISESLEIEKCSICLEKLVNTVLFWPCTHWFCSNCVSTLYRNAQADKVTCPLCKTVTSRRSVLSFQDKQNEYADYLQTLIGALSMDLGFDITSYKNNSRYKTPLENEQYKLNKTPATTPIRKSVQRKTSKTIGGESNLSSNKNRRITRSSDLRTSTNFKSSIVSPILLPETPKNQREEKVKEWLATTKFSQVNPDCLTENVVVDIHKSESQSPALSEDQLLSVTQTFSKPTKVPVRCISLKPKVGDQPSDTEDIRPFDEAPLNNRSKSISNSKQKLISPEEQFDKLLPERKKRRHITATYGSKTQYNTIERKKRSFTVDSNLFLEEPKNEVRTDKSYSSPDSLEDFSSGSGEVWTAREKSKQRESTKNLKKKQIPKSTKKQTWQRGLDPVFNSTSKLNSTNHDRNIKEMLLKDKESKCKNKMDSTTSINTNKLNKVENCEKDIMQEIRNDWLESQDTEAVKEQNVMAAPKLQDDNLLKCKRPYSVNLHNQNTPIKHNNERSPGWSRIKTTKKEFHMTEKKKLNLKTVGKKSMLQSTINNIGISLLTNTASNQNLFKDCKTPTNIQKTRLTPINLSKNKSPSVEKCLSSLNIENTIDHKVISDHDCIRKEGSQTIGNVINHSFTSSSSGSPFNGFKTPDKSVIKSVVLLGVKKDENLNKSPVSTECKEQNDLLRKTKEKLVIESTENSNKTSETPFSKETSHINEVSDVIKEGTEEVENHEQRLTSNKHCVSGKFNLILTNPENSSKYLDNLQEKTSTDCLIKKRDRDSGIHNESSFCSPVRKRICRDAEVQTSPGRMQSFVKDYLKTMLGSEVENIFDNTSKILHINSCHGAVSDKSPTAIKTSIQNKLSPKSLSQSSDKENIQIFNKENTCERFLNDSDLVLGTEDHLSRNFLKHSNDVIDDKARRLETQTTKNNSNISENQMEMSTDDFVFETGLVVDHEALTQPYKTPIVPKQKLIPSSSNLYSAVSNPTDSELKKAEQIFLLQRDEICPDETPKVPLTPWNDSGINKLEGLSTELKRDVVKSASQILKDNRSRRHLDFDEDSNDMFEAITTKKDGDIERIGDAKIEENVTKNHNSTCIEIDVQPNNDEESNHSLESDNIVNESPSKSRKIHRFNKMEELPNDNTLKVYNESVDDYIVEATPDVSQMEKEQVPVSRKIDENSILNNLITSQQCESSFSAKEITEKELDHDALRTTVIDKEIKNKSVADEVAEKSKEIQLEQYCFASSQQCESSFSAKEITEKELDHDDLRTTVIDKEIENKSVADEVAEKSKEIQLEQYCFASSLLNSKQTHVLMRVLNGLSIPYSKTVGPHVSHLVVGTTNGRTQNTYKFLYAMALHRPVIRYDWVEAVIASGETQTLEPYLALDPSGECGVLRAKKDKDRHLLQDFAIHVYNVNVRVIQKEQLEELISLCGGTVVTSLHQFASVSRHLYKVIILAEPVDTSTQADWREKYGAAELSIDWLYNSIGRYRVVPLGQYMIEPNGAVAFLMHQGYPEELIFDPPTQAELAL